MNLNLNKIIKDKIYVTLDHLYDELDKSYAIKKMLECENDFGEMITNETRIKLIKSFIKVFKLLRKKDNHTVLVLITLHEIQKRIKLHLYQLRRMKMKKEICEDNRLYFTVLLRVAYSLRQKNEIH
tara:strand:- start:3582 stop:3959 length:378 start_codon:yes stop_codon:yes gene_type:complete